MYPIQLQPLLFSPWVKMLCFQMFMTLLDKVFNLLMLFYVMLLTSMIKVLNSTYLHNPLTMKA